MQALIDARVKEASEKAAKDARDAAFAEARRMFEGKAKGTPKKAEPKREAVEEPPGWQEQMRLRDGLDEATAELKLTAGQKQLLRNATIAAAPEDVGGFVNDFIAKAGWAQQPQEKTATPKPPPPNSPAPAGTVPSELGENYLAWTDSQRNAYLRRQGADPNRPYDQKTWPAYRKLAAEVKAGLSSGVIQLGPRRS